jgi:spermidine/putrescine transport system ATP-binding protein
MSEFSDFASPLGGGQQQRIALARALVNRLAFSCSMSPSPRFRCQSAPPDANRIEGIAARSRITFIFVTHDQEEPWHSPIASRYFRSGFLEQVAEPRQIYGQPASLT